MTRQIITGFALTASVIWLAAMLVNVGPAGTAFLLVAYFARFIP